MVDHEDNQGGNRRYSLDISPFSEGVLADFSDSFLDIFNLLSLYEKDQQKRGDHQNEGAEVYD